MGTTPDTDEDGSEFTGDAQQHLVGGVGKPQQAIVVDDMMTVMVVAILEICCPIPVQRIFNTAAKAPAAKTRGLLVDYRRDKMVLDIDQGPAPAEIGQKLTPAITLDVRATG
jgi:hypothetical protein